jgi:hypothetical protein
MSELSRYKVRKGQDAYLFYETVVEAESAEEAYEIADASGYTGAWIPAGFAEYDDFTIFDDEIELMDDDEDIIESAVHELTPEERNHILASLRLWQRTPDYARGAETDIAIDGGHARALTNEEIDELCERLNV